MPENTGPENAEDAEIVTETGELEIAEPVPTLEPVPTSALPTTTSLTVIDRNNPYVGVATGPFSKEAAEHLLAPVPDDEIEVRPDGLIYWPASYYRDRLNAAFGPGAWSIIELRDPFVEVTTEEAYGKTKERKLLYYTGALFALNRFIAKSIGKQEYFEGNKGSDWDDAVESAKTKCLVRCCKDLGIGSDLSKPAFARRWVKANAVKVWCDYVGTGEGKGKFLWRHKDADPIDMYPVREGGRQQGGGNSSGNNNSNGYDPRNNSREDPREREQPASNAASKPATQQAREQVQQKQEPAAQAGAIGAQAKPKSAVRPWDSWQLSGALALKAGNLAKAEPDNAKLVTAEQLEEVVFRLAVEVFPNHKRADYLAEVLLAWCFGVEQDWHKLAEYAKQIDEGGTKAEFNNAECYAVTAWLEQSIEAARLEAEIFVKDCIRTGVYLAEAVSEIAKQAVAEDNDGLPF